MKKSFLVFFISFPLLCLGQLPQTIKVGRLRTVDVRIPRNYEVHLYYSSGTNEFRYKLSDGTDQPLGSGTTSAVAASSVTTDAQRRFVADTSIATWNSKQNALGYIPLSPSGNLSGLANVATARTNLGLGTLATQASSAVAITGGSITSVTALTTTGAVTARRVLGSSAAPAGIVGTGAGTGATITFNANSNDTGGQITIITGTTPAASAQIARITYTAAYPNVSFPTITPANANASAVFPYLTSTTTYFDLNAGPVALAASTTYVFNYTVTGK